MKSELLVKQSTLRILYFRYKPYLIPFFVIFICAIIFIQVIIPQIQNTINLYTQLQNERKHIAIINQNISLAAKLDDAALTNSLQIVLKVLPQEKDFAGILNAITKAAGTANISLGDYNVQIGSLAKVPVSTAIGAGNNAIPITLTVNGTIPDVQRFLHALKNQLPLSDVKNVQMDKGKAVRITVGFYYQPFTNLTFNPTIPLANLSQKEQQVIDGYNQ